MFTLTGSVIQNVGWNLDLVSEQGNPARIDIQGIGIVLTPKTRGGHHHTGS